jgi:hypothetical protein
MTCTRANSAYHHRSCKFVSCSWRGVLDTTLYDKVCHCLSTGRWFSPVSTTNGTDYYDNGYSWNIVIILTLILLENEAHFFKINETLTITCYREPVLTTITYIMVTVTLNDTCKINKALNPNTNEQFLGCFVKFGQHCPQNGNLYL